MTDEQKRQIDEYKKYMTPYQLMALIVCLETNNHGRVTEIESISSVNVQTKSERKRGGRDD